MTRYLTGQELLLIHFELIERYGGSHGVRDLKRVKSVIAAPKQEAFGREQYLTLYEKAAVYARNIVGDHPFTDGNKRTAVTAAVIFLQLNGHKFTSKVGEIEDFAVHIATKQLGVPIIAAWFEP